MTQSAKDTPAISVVINTKNAAATLEKALQSVKDLASEVIVVDMKSSDETVRIARRFTSNIFDFPDDLGYADPARDFANGKATADWIFVLDADEEVPASLANKVKELVEDSSEVACWFVPRQNFIFGKYLKHTGWWPDYQPRLFKKGTVSWKVGVHRFPDISGRVEYLPAEEKYALRHSNYPTITSYLQRLDRYTTVAASETKSSEVNNSATLFKTFSQEFLSRLFAQNGVKDGAQGVSLSLLQGTYELSTALKVWENKDFKSVKSAESDQFEFIKELQNFHRDLAYWVADYQVQHSSGVSRIWWKLRRKLKI